MSKLAVIGGSGFNQLPEFNVKELSRIETPYGEPSSELVHGELDGLELVFIARHGFDHTIAPHRINYRANLYALRSVGVENVIALAAVGGIAAETREGGIVIPHQIIDYTWGREHTFYDGFDHVGSDIQDVLDHIDFTSPYDSGLRSQLLESAQRNDVSVVNQGNYAVTQGPRLESAGEIDRLEKDGADIVGMTGMPEASLARELGLAYVCIALVVNPAAGRGTGEISMELIYSNLAIASGKALAIIKGLTEGST